MKKYTPNSDRKKVMTHFQKAGMWAGFVISLIAFDHFFPTSNNGVEPKGTPSLELNAQELSPK